MSKGSRVRSDQVLHNLYNVCTCTKLNLVHNPGLRVLARVRLTKTINIVVGVQLKESCVGGAVVGGVGDGGGCGGGWWLTGMLRVA